PFVRRRAFHSGLDFATPTGTRILATGSGRVARAGWMGGYGRMVEINHGNGLSTRYAHLSRISVKSGQRVTAGDVIGRAGSTGRSTGPHLHYETRIDGKAVDPMRFLSAL
ncbi:MAG: M23 family metallopeptidase, partial [Pseudomonadota bacterium]